MRSFLLVLSMCLAVLGCQMSSSAEILGPGTYYGQFITDRWGQQVFHNGTSYFFVSDKVAQQLKGYEGKFLTVEVKEMYQPRNPGGGMIESIGNVVADKESASSLKVDIQTAKVERGQGVALHLTLQNISKKQIQITPWDLTLVFVTNEPFSNAAIGYKDQYDRAYWYYNTSVFSRKNTDSWLQVACHEVPLPWHPQQYAAQGLGVTVGPQTPTHMDPGTYYPLIIEPNGKLEIDITAGQELLAGEYEIFLYQKSNGSSRQKASTSNHAKFDVIAPSPK